jgi:ABC-type multidrug transport system ATPase subunit
MSQRLAIARALLHDPPVMVFDEPDTGLDRESLERLSELIELLRKGRRAVLFTTHDLKRAFRWADRVCELRAGSLHHLEGSKRSEYCEV